MRGHTREWVAQEPIQRQIGRRFRNFLDRFKDNNGDLVYRDRIKDMCIREFCGMGQTASLCGSCCLGAGTIQGLQQSKVNQDRQRGHKPRCLHD